MSIDATSWAWIVPVRSSAQRLILLSLADRAGEDHKCYPSNKRLAEDTVLNIKTVQKVVNELIELGFVLDTGERKGHTKQVRVLQLVGVNSRENNKPNFGTAKQPQKRNDTEIGKDTNNGVVITPQTNPILEGNEPKNGICNEPNFGIGNLPMNLSRNLVCENNEISENQNSSPEENSVEHTLKLWTPNFDSLNSWLQRSGLPKITQAQAEEILLELNPHYENKIRTGAVSDTQMYSNFVKWVKRDIKLTEKLFEHATQTQPAQSQPQNLNLPEKPKGFLGGRHA